MDCPENDAKNCKQKFKNMMGECERTPDGRCGRKIQGKIALNYDYFQKWEIINPETGKVIGEAKFPMEEEGKVK